MCDACWASNTDKAEGVLTRGASTLGVPLLNALLVETRTGVEGFAPSAAACLSIPLPKAVAGVGEWGTGADADGMNVVLYGCSC